MAISSVTGVDLELLADSAFAPAAAAIAERRIPGATLGIVTATGSCAVRLSGAAQLMPEHRPLTREAWFDLASLTKVIFTAAKVLELAEAGRIDLDAPLASAIPDLRQYELQAAERRLTFRQCLGHQTHLPAVEPIYTYGNDPRSLRACVLQRAWKAGPPVYSDINFILLGIALERLLGAGIRDLATPPGLTFRPDSARSVATERCAWRGRMIVGEVHDENAYAMQGAGHAGLFGTVDGVMDFAQGLMNGTAATGSVARLMRKTIAGHRTHGWESAFPGWPGGDHCSSDTIGHTGFTGTGLWIDFERRLAWTLLTNRVHPTRFCDSGIAALRRATGDLVTRGLPA